jgi:hypothetical protein
MSKPKAPKPTSPTETSAAATGTSVATAIANSQLNNVNQVGPDGSLTFSNEGSYTWTDPYTNQTYTIPKTTATTTYSPEQQAIADQQNAANLSLSTAGANQAGFLKDYLSTPWDGSNDATEARLLELASKRLNPELDRKRADLETRLSNQGIKLGSTAYDRAMEQNSQAENDALNQLLLTGHGQAFSEGQAMRNQPINETTALLSGSQVSQPQFGNYNQGSIPTTDNAGLINSNYAQRQNNYQNELGQWNSTVGGLFGLGSAFVGA